MSLQTQRNAVARLQREVSDLRKKLANEQRKAAAKQQHINNLQRSIASATSASIVASKTRQLERYSDDLARCNRRLADIERRLAEKQQELYRAQEKLSAEEQRETKRIAEAQAERRRELQEYQRALAREIERQRQFFDIRYAGFGNGSGGAAGEEYDVFVCHASEDKEEFVRPLVAALEKRGLRVWYDEHALRVGDSLRRSIVRGLAKSRFGIVVLSASFFKKEWPQKELDGLVSKEMAGGKVILPIWHKVSVGEVRRYSPTLADRVALNSAMLSIEEIAEKVHEVVRGDKHGKGGKRQ